MEDIKIKAGQQIKSARIAKGLTQQELGDLVGIKRAAVSKYEKGEQNMTLETIVKMATALGLKVSLDLV